jgi:hypothetical protein
LYWVAEQSQAVSPLTLNLSLQNKQLRQTVHSELTWGKNSQNQDVVIDFYWNPRTHKSTALGLPSYPSINKPLFNPPNESDPEGLCCLQMCFQEPQGAAGTHWEVPGSQGVSLWGAKCQALMFCFCKWSILIFKTLGGWWNYLLKLLSWCVEKWIYFLDITEQGGASFVFTSAFFMGTLLVRVK